MRDTDRLSVHRAGADGAIAVLALQRPAVLNALDSALLDSLERALAAIEIEEDVRAVVLAGAGGRAFSSGMDLVERAGFSDDQLRAQRHAIVALIAHVHELSVPTIAAVEGYALAGGFELALACDLIVASRTATFGLPEVRVGIFPGGGSTQTLTWIVGPARARDLILTGRRISGEEAEAWGIVARLAEPGEALPGAVALAEAIAQGAPLGVRQARAAIRGSHRSLAEGLAAENELYETVLRSEDRVEGFRAFAEKRAPRFKGR
jgi:enoyl-CoA hydratase/carnithine racemase